MGKKANTFIFMGVMTLISVVISLILILSGTLLMMYIGSKVEALSNSGIYWAVSTAFVFIGGAALSFFIYNKVVKFAVAKWNLEDKLYPFFAPRKGK